VKPGEAVANSDEWLLATASMASAEAIQALCQAIRFKIYYILQQLITAIATHQTGQVRIQNLHPHICCATHND
jgi:hypothetical protein